MSNKEKPMIIQVWDFLKSASGAAILAIVGFAIGIYGLLVEHEAELRISGISLSTVFDIHQAVGGLEVSYAGENLRTSKKTLWSATLTMQNTGKASIRKGDFDELAPVGLLITNGEIVDKPTSNGSNEYINKNIRILATKNELTISPIILEPNDFVRMNFLILGPEGAPPSIAAKGKIAGIRAIELDRPNAQGNEQTFVQRLVGAESWGIQLLRGPIYAIALVFELLAIFSVLGAISSAVEKFQDAKLKITRGAALKGLKVTHKNEEFSRLLQEEYLKDGQAALDSLCRIKKTLDVREGLHKCLSEKLPSDEVAKLCKRRYPSHPADWRLAAALQKCGAIESSGHLKLVTPDCANWIDELIKHLDFDPGAGLKRLAEYWERDEREEMTEEMIVRAELVRYK